MNLPPASRKLEVQIMDQSYTLSCPEGSEDTLLEAVGKVDSTMCAIRDTGKLKARERIAVLAALNLAYILTDRQPPAATVTHAAADTPSDALPAPEYLDQLIQRLDQALDSDGHLL